MDDFDVAVIGAGHAGIEAASAASKMGCKTAMFTVSLDQIGNMPCNPSIGGTAKGHLVREIDALGGEMGKAADKCSIQSRMLNMGKGPAVHSLRVQADRTMYHNYMKQRCEEQKNLYVKQAEIVAILTENGRVCAIRTALGAEYSVKAVVIASGTYLKGKIHVGEASFDSGPDAVKPTIGLSDSLKSLGITLRRFKTGTPCRVHKRSIDFTQLEIQCGDEKIVPFSFTTIDELSNKADCYIAYTNAETHRVIRENLHRSPLYSGRIEGVGPRYCPSIEDKVVRFPDKERHQIFVEPMGLSTDEYYLQGMSSSLPEDVQLEFLRTIRGLENVEIMRPAYAIEYDCCDSTELKLNLEFRQCAGLFGAGQFNGSSGYEEAGAQGIVAGINAAKYVRGEESFILDRSSSYIGTLIDDLVTKGVSDPYRMMTSRSEYRLILRQDNADLRLTEYGHELGLVNDADYEAFLQKKSAIDAEYRRVSRVNISPSSEINDFLINIGTAPLSTGAKLADLIRRPQLDYAALERFDENRTGLPDEVCYQVELMVKYEGYIKKELERIESMKKLEKMPLPDDFDYGCIKGLRLEAAEKLNRQKPCSIGQASRITGVSPADITVLLVYFRHCERD